MKNFILQTIFFFFKLAAVILLLFKAHHYERGRSCVGGGEGSENMEAKWPAVTLANLALLHVIGSRRSMSGKWATRFTGWGDANNCVIVYYTEFL